MSATSPITSHESGDLELDVEVEFSKDYNILRKSFMSPIDFEVDEENSEISEIPAENSSHEIDNVDADIFSIQFENKMLTRSLRRFELALLEAEKEKLLDTVASMTSHIDELESDRTEKEREICRLKNVVYNLEQTNFLLRFQITVNTITTSSSQSKTSELNDLANDLIEKLNDEVFDTFKDEQDLDSKASSKKSISRACAYYPTPMNGPSSNPNGDSYSSWFWFGSCL